MSRVASPKVSIILPVYNAAATLRDTLNSIRQQTFQNYELIIVDDGSNDDSYQIAQQFQVNDPRIRIIRQHNQGVVAASNRALELARAPYVARMDADDLMYPQRIAAQYDYLQQHPEVDLVGCQVKLFPEEQVQGGFREYMRWQNQCLSVEDMQDERYVELTIANPTICFRREVIQDIGAYREGDFPEDYDLLLRLSQQGHQLAKVEQVLLAWRESESRLTRSDSKYSREAFDQLRANYLSQDPRLHAGRALYVWGAGRRTRQRANLLLEKGIEFAAWIDIDPKKIGNIVQGIPVHSPQVLLQARPFVLVYVNNHGARDLIAEDLAKMNYQRGLDYLMVG